MAEPTTLSTRRMLILGGVAGLVAGGAWGAALQALARPSGTVVSVIGFKESQIALLDTGDVRVLVLLGPPSDRLINSIPVLTTVLNRRVDIIVGSPDAMAALGSDFRSRWNVGHHLVVPLDGAAGPDTPGRTTVDRDLALSLHDDVEFQIHCTMRNAWNAAISTTRFWAACVVTPRGTIVLAPNAASARALMPAASDLLITPEADVDGFPRIALAINATHEADTPGAGFPRALIRIFPSDVARFTYGDEGIILPAWAVLPE